MKVIKSSNQYNIQVDDEDYNFLNKFSWHANKEKRSVNKRVADRGPNYQIRRMHRLIMSCPNNLTVDHINGDTLDNRKENLRICSSIENNRNKPKTQRKTTSKYKGVSWSNINNKWYSYIKFNHKGFNLGLYDNEIDAALAYDQKAIELHGEFANTNFKRRVG